MGCPHEAWEQDTASEADGLCPLCLKAMLELSERRLASSERIRTALVELLHKTQDELTQALKS